MATDWEFIRKTARTTERPEEWPKDVVAVSIESIGLLGIHAKDNKLYWDGKEIVTRQNVRLGNREWWLAFAVLIVTTAGVALEFAKAFGWVNNCS